MALTVGTLTSVAEDTVGLLDVVAELKKAGVDEKTDLLEQSALALIAKLREAVIEAGEKGSSDSDQVRASLEAEESALRKFLNETELTLSERMSLLNRLSDVQFKLGQLIIGRTFTWNRLLSSAEIAMFERALSEAAAQVRRRKKLQTVVRSLFSILSIGTSLVSKILLL